MIRLFVVSILSTISTLSFAEVSAESYGEPDFYNFTEVEDVIYKNPWMVETPKTEKSGPSKSIGEFAAGCLENAFPVDDRSKNFSLMRLERHRNYGHDRTAAFIEDLADHIARTKKNQILVGDIGQPMGGPIFYPGNQGYRKAHGSHQTGLDIDIWYLQAPRSEVIPYNHRSSMTAVDMADYRRRGVTKDWGPEQLEALKFTAQHPSVRKILIDPSIKNHLCETFTSRSDRALLRKFRPVRAHNYHYHVRLKCEANDTLCEDDAEPTTEACNLEEFFRRPTRPPGPPKPPVRILKLPKLPIECRPLL